MSDKLKVGILGGTGMVGQRFISYLQNVGLLQLLLPQTMDDSRATK